MIKNREYGKFIVEEMGDGAEKKKY